MRKAGTPLFNRRGTLFLHALFGSGFGFAPDLNSDYALATFPEASATTIEKEDADFTNEVQPPWGLDGMMPPPQVVYGKTQPGLKAGEEGVGGAGSFLTATAQGAKG